ncbi:Arabinose efflux permease [Cedecea neteri]|uniref:Arabinose efflux permease n=1 Tax=Cedecea neteri TaxID=158822 RepID=A0A2X3JA27_9ENTR|nr:Arabinose efflux permease [Cedecea neteri]
MPRATKTFSYQSLMRIAIVMAFIQFTNALEYMALTPVFAFMADGFSVPVSFSGYVSGMYTLGAVLSGIAAFYMIDRFNKKRFLVTNMVLLGAFTFLITLTRHFDTLLALRFCAGLVGGTTMGGGDKYFDKLCPG